MNSVTFKAVAAALLLGCGATAMAANDGQVRVNGLLSSDPQYRETWQGVVKKEERVPDWVLNLTGESEQQMSAVEEDGDKYLVGPLCESQQVCKNHRLIVAFSWDKKHAYGMLVDVPEGLPSDKSPTRHADYRWLGKPNEGMQALLKEQLKRDPNWY
ncbi:inhibitor of vertebrate lysozyme family protein [Pseudomonas sp. RIT-To-2]|uniref:inhibitor of vertebrate lysozyme family protein n=1 Tax=Pseudomonas sp. RIT-To-2 TaxID=3462541 RepID=UPI002413931E